MKDYLLSWHEMPQYRSWEHGRKENHCMMLACWNETFRIYEGLFDFMTWNAPK
jgi:hypothetical protein